MGTSCTNPTRIPPPAAGSRLVFLCKASDDASEPQNADHYRALFNRNQRDLMFDYFQTISGGALDVSGTEVYGWFTMSVSTAQLAPTIRNLITSPGRAQTVQDCKSAGAAALLATGRLIEPDNYAGIIAVINVPVDAGSSGFDVVANANEPASFYGHEMLHTMYIPHSNLMAADLLGDHSWNLGGDVPYNDCRDIMSYDICIYTFNTPAHGKQGPELQVAYKQKLGWVPAARIFARDNRVELPSTVILAPVSEPNLPGFLMANIEIANVGNYVIEYRVPSGFDRAIPNAAVVIRELRSNGETYLVQRQNTETGWQQGQQFTDKGNFLSINVDAMTPQSATITINPRYSNSLSAGDICGNKYIGIALQCPVGTACNPRITPPATRGDPPLVSVDYFCL